MASEAMLSPTPIEHERTPKFSSKYKVAEKEKVEKSHEKS